MVGVSELGQGLRFSFYPASDHSTKGDFILENSQLEAWEQLNKRL